jgi:hypothetical protein
LVQAGQISAKTSIAAVRVVAPPRVTARSPQPWRQTWYVAGLFVQGGRMGPPPRDRPQFSKVEVTPRGKQTRREVEGAFSSRALLRAKQHFKPSYLSLNPPSRRSPLLAFGYGIGRAPPVLPSRLATALQTFRRPGSRGTPAMHPTAGVLARLEVSHCRSLTLFAAAAFCSASRRGRWIADKIVVL